MSILNRDVLSKVENSTSFDELLSLIVSISENKEHHEYKTLVRVEELSYWSLGSGSFGKAIVAACLSLAKEDNFLALSYYPVIVKTVPGVIPSMLREAIGVAINYVKEAKPESIPANMPIYTLLEALIQGSYPTEQEQCIFLCKGGLAANLLTTPLLQPALIGHWSPEFMSEATHYINAFACNNPSLDRSVQHLEHIDQAITVCNKSSSELIKLHLGKQLHSTIEHSLRNVVDVFSPPVFTRTKNNIKSKHAHKQIQVHAKLLYNHTTRLEIQLLNAVPCPFTRNRLKATARWKHYFKTLISKQDYASLL